MTKAIGPLTANRKNFTGAIPVKHLEPAKIDQNAYRKYSISELSDEIPEKRDLSYSMPPQERDSRDYSRSMMSSHYRQQSGGVGRDNISPRQNSTQFSPFKQSRSPPYNKQFGTMNSSGFKYATYKSDVSQENYTRQSPSQIQKYGDMQSRTSPQRDPLTGSQLSSVGQSTRQQQIRSEKKKKLEETFTESYPNYDRRDLENILEANQLFPEHARPAMWRSLLQLPMNQPAYEELVAKGLHPDFEDLPTRYNLRSQRLLKKLQRNCSLLAHLNPQFGKMDYLPGLVYPFVKLFGGDDLLCFEVILTFLLNWGQHFLDAYPHPPWKILQSAENIIQHHDKELYEHFQFHKFSIAENFLSLYQTLFSTMLSSRDWLIVMDFIAFNADKPEYFVLFPVAFALCNREAILDCDSFEAIEEFFRRQESGKIHVVLNKVKRLPSRTPGHLMPPYFETLTPLRKGDEYQKIKIGYGTLDTGKHFDQLDEKLKTEERKIQYREKKFGELQSLTEQLLNFELRYRKNHEESVRREMEQRKILLHEEEAYLQRKLQLESEARERRYAQLKEVERSIFESLRNAESEQNKQLQALDQEIRTRRDLDDMLLRSKEEEEKLLALELSQAQKLRQVLEDRTRQEKEKKMRKELEFREKEIRLKEQIKAQEAKLEEEEFRARREALKNQKLLELQKEQEQSEKLELNRQMLLRELERQLKETELEREVRMRKLVQDEMYQTEEWERLKEKQMKVIEKEDQRQLEEILRRENQRDLDRARERADILQLERQKHEQEMALMNEKMKEVTNKQRKLEFEEQLRAIKDASEKRLLRREQELQELITELRHTRNKQLGIQQESLMSDSKVRSRREIIEDLKAQEREIVREEERRFTAFKRALEEELEDQRRQQRTLKEETQDRSAIAADQENLMNQILEEKRKKLRAENMLNYLEEELYTRKSQRNDRSKEYSRDRRKSDYGDSLLSSKNTQILVTLA